MLLLAAHRAIAAPSTRREALALLALGLAVYARTQFAVFAVVLPVAALAHDLLYAVAVRDGGSRRCAVQLELRRLPRRRPLFTTLVLVAVAVIASGQLNRLTGIYGGVVSGELFPPGIATAAAAHLAYIAVGAGVLPFVLGAAWTIQTFVRPPTKAEHAFVVLATLAVTTLTVVAASFDLRILGDVIADRYLFYVVPVLCVAFVMALSAGRLAPLAIAAACGVFAALALSNEFVASGVLFFLTPASPYHQVITDQAAWLAELPGLHWLETNMLIVLVAAIGACVAASSCCAVRRSRRWRSSAA